LALAESAGEVQVFCRFKAQALPSCLHGSLDSLLRSTVEFFKPVQKGRERFMVPFPESGLNAFEDRIVHGGLSPSGYSLAGAVES
jgi:hypothetical protein